MSSSRFSPRGERIYKLMLELVAIPSVTGSDGGEVRCAQFIYDRLSRLDYFRQNAGDLRLISLPNDPLGRFSVFALLRAAHPTKRTVILTGHFDVVDTDVCGSLQPFAFQPEEYTKRVAGLALPKEAREDLESGNYLFGRGVSDMKTGVAVDICLLEEYAGDRQEMDFNILLLLVPDEEGDSVGMRGSISSLAEIQQSEGLEFLLCINTEPVFESFSPAVYYGTIGKIMPLYLCVGRESHVGEYYEGLNSTLIASYLNISLDGGRDTIEEYGEQNLQPQCCLRMRDLRNNYAVTLPERCVVYYNCLTVSKTPAEILEEMKKKAQGALVSAFSHVGRTDWVPRVLTVEEVLNKASELLGVSKKRLVSDLMEKIPEGDERERNIEFLSEVLDLIGEKGPFIVTGFVPPFYPSRSNKNKSVGERAVRNAASSVRELLKKNNLELKEIEIFQGITDLSYMGFQGGLEEIVPLALNTPLWGEGYELSLDELRKINIPSVILGPIGRDAHKITERVELNYSLNVLPSVLKEFIGAVIRYNQN